LNLHLVVALAHDLRIVAPRTNLDARNRLDGGGNRAEVGLLIEANGNLVAAGTEFDLGGALFPRAARVSGFLRAVAKRLLQSFALLLVEAGGLLYANEKAIGVAGIGHRNDVGRREPGTVHSGSNGGGVHRLGEGHLDLGAAFEVGTVGRQRPHQRAEQGHGRSQKAEADPVHPDRHEVPDLAVLEELH
jgi:hypothetical protein